MEAANSSPCASVSASSGTCPLELSRSRRPYGSSWSCVSCASFLVEHFRGRTGKVYHQRGLGNGCGHDASPCVERRRFDEGSSPSRMRCLRLSSHAGFRCNAPTEKPLSPALSWRIPAWRCAGYRSGPTKGFRLHVQSFPDSDSLESGSNVCSGHSARNTSPGCR